MLLEMNEVKKQCRIDEDFNGEDDLLKIYVGAAEKRTTSFLNRMLYLESVPDTDPDGLLLSDDIKLGMLHLISYWYDNRASASEVEQFETPMSFSFLIGPYRYIPL